MAKMVLKNIAFFRDFIHIRGGFTLISIAAEMIHPGGVEDTDNYIGMLHDRTYFFDFGGIRS